MENRKVAALKIFGVGEGKECYFVLQLSSNCPVTGRRRGGHTLKIRTFCEIGLIGGQRYFEIQFISGSSSKVEAEVRILAALLLLKLLTAAANNAAWSSCWLLKRVSVSVGLWSGNCNTFNARKCSAVNQSVSVLIEIGSRCC